VEKVTARRHRGDIMSPEKRSAVMSRIRSKDTLPERLVSNAMATRGLKWEEHARDLPGCPDMVFRQEKVAVFIDGDFWHGWRFPLWKDKLSESWEEKIGRNRERDKKNHDRLRRLGWKVIRLWEHQIHGDIDKVIGRILAVLGYEK